MKTTTQHFALLLNAILRASVTRFGRTNIFASNRATPGNAFSLPGRKSLFKRLLVRRMTKNQHDAIRTAGTDFLICRTNTIPGFDYNEGTKWKAVATPAGTPRQKNSRTKIL